MKKKKQHRNREPRCRICGCTHMRPCPAGCGWMEGEGDLCTVCAAMRDELAIYLEACNRVTGASLNRLLREAA